MSPEGLKLRVRINFIERYVHDIQPKHWQASIRIHVFGALAVMFIYWIGIFCMLMGACHEAI